MKCPVDINYVQLVQCKACISLLILCLHDLSIGVRGILMYPTIIVLLLIFPLIVVTFALFTGVLLCWVNIYL